MKNLILGAAVLGVPFLSAQSERPDGPPRPPGPPPPPPVLIVLDADHDGIISAAEILQAPQNLLTLDKNKNGQVEKDELRPPRPSKDETGRPERKGSREDQKRGDASSEGQGKRHGPPPFPLLIVLDVNKDGTLSADEISAASNHLKALDANSDGQLGPGEYGPKPPKRDDEPQPSPSPAN